MASIICRSWQCGDCAPKRKRALIAQACSGQGNIFITLTCRIGAMPTPIDAAKRLAWCWRVIRLRLMRRHGWKKLPFIAVFERTVNGWPHLHIITRSGFIDAAFVSAAMAELLDSPIVKIKAIDNRGRLAGYVSKYMGKDAHKFGKAKRYWSSRDYDLRPPPEKPWKLRYNPFITVEPSPLHKLVAVYRAQGWSIEQESPWRATCIPRPPPARKREPV